MNDHKEKEKAPIVMIGASIGLCQLSPIIQALALCSNPKSKLLAGQQACPSLLSLWWRYDITNSKCF